MSKRYIGGYTHPSFDSSSEVREDGAVLVKVNVYKREGVLIKTIGTKRYTVSALTERLQTLYPRGGFNQNHVSHALSRLHQGQRPLVHVRNGEWYLTADSAKILAAHKAVPKKIHTPKGV